MADGELPDSNYENLASRGVDVDLYKQSQKAAAKALESTGEAKMNHLAEAIRLLVDSDPTDRGLSRDYIENAYTQFGAFNHEDIDNALNRLAARDQVNVEIYERFSSK